LTLNRALGRAAQTQDPFSFLFLLMLAILMMGTLTVPLLIAEEREKHTLDAILLSPASTWDLILGKAIVGLLYTLGACGLLVLLNDELQNDLVPLLVTILIGAWMMVEIGLLEGAFLNNIMQVNAGGSLAFLLLFLPALLPSVRGVPAQIMHLIPTWYLFEALRDSISGVAWSYLASNLLVMVMIAVLLGLLGPWVLHKQLVR
jgi:ABC-2 type transport system permease protein